MADDKIVELGRHEPSVDGIIERLGRHRERISQITVIIEWDDGSSDIHHESREVSGLAYDSVLLNKYVQSLIADAEDE